MSVASFKSGEKFVSSSDTSSCGTCSSHNCSTCG
jgi:positive regulator of sigma E activity